MSLELKDVCLTYADGDARLVALDRVSLTVAAGELVAVAGPSGSGKSSLLAVAGTLLRPDLGGVLVGGLAVGDLQERERTRLRRDRIGIVFQQANLIASLTVAEQLLLMNELRGRRQAVGDRHSQASKRQAVDDLLAAVGLAGKEHRRPHQLSGGERQRVNIARALTGSPDVLLVDEPTSALDHGRGAEIMTLIARLTVSRSVATLLVTHDQANLGVADRVAEMHDGVLSESVGAGS